MLLTIHIIIFSQISKTQVFIIYFSIYIRLNGSLQFVDGQSKSTSDLAFKVVDVLLVALNISVLMSAVLCFLFLHTRKIHYTSNSTMSVGTSDTGHNS